MTNYAAQGTLLKQGDGGATEVFTTVAQVGSISGPTLTADQADVTSHTTSSGNYREHVATLLEPGELSCELFFDPAHATHDNSTGILKDYEDRTLRNWQVVFPDAAATTWLIAAFVTGFEIGAPVDGALTASLTLKLSGQPTLA